MVECPYCGDDKKPRGLKNHVRMATGDGHGSAGTVPDDFDDRLEADESDDAENGDSDGENGGDSVTTVTPDELREIHDDESDADTDGSDGEGDDSLPFDPNDPDAIRLDGGESMDIRDADGEIYPGVEADEGDYLLKTDKGPVLYDADDGEMYEVLTV